MQIDVKQIQETRAFSCLECGKCTGTCPVSRYSKTFSPRLLLTKAIRNTHPDSLKSPDLWTCLTCQRCDEICPQQINYIEFTQLIRQFVGVANREGTCSHGGILESISRIMTSPNLQQQRLAWVEDDLQTSKSSEYLFFVGCAPYFDALFDEIGVKSSNIAKSTLKILNYFNIKPQVLENEKCCGHDFIWNGDFANFKKLGEANIEQLKKTGAKTVITSCPECYRTLKIDYPKYFNSPPFEVIHISEFLSEKVKEKQLRLKSEEIEITFQDPCRLGRHLKIYEPPREVLHSLEGIRFNEMSNHKRRAICCGVSGWMNCSQISKQIQAQRLREAGATGAKLLVTSCAKCQIHFKCALQDKNLFEEIPLEVKDLTELFAEHLH